MTRTKWNELIAKANEHAKELSKIMGQLLDAAENDRIFKKTGPMYAVAEGELIPKWECRSVTCIWGDAKTIESRSIASSWAASRARTWWPTRASIPC